MRVVLWYVCASKLNLWLSLAFLTYTILHSNITVCPQTHVSLDSDPALIFSTKNTTLTKNMPFTLVGLPDKTTVRMLQTMTACYYYSILFVCCCCLAWQTMISFPSPPLVAMASKPFLHCKGPTMGILQSCVCVLCWLTLSSRSQQVLLSSAN